MALDDLTIGDARKLASMFPIGTATVPTPGPHNPLRLENPVFIRTVTHYYVGRLVEITPDVLVLIDASWVADTGRFNNALVTGTLNEVEPFPRPVAINRASIVDITVWPHPLPLTVK